MAKKEDIELHFLRWFFSECDFGPSDGDVRYYMMKDYQETYGELPKGYGEEYFDDE